MLKECRQFCSSYSQAKDLLPPDFFLLTKVQSQCRQQTLLILEIFQSAFKNAFFLMFFFFLAISLFALTLKSRRERVLIKKIRSIILNSSINQVNKKTVQRSFTVAAKSTQLLPALVNVTTLFNLFAYRIYIPIISEHK